MPVFAGDLRSDLPASNRSERLGLPAGSLHQQPMSINATTSEGEKIDMPITLNGSRRESPFNRCSRALKPAFMRSSESVAIDLQTRPLGESRKAAGESGLGRLSSAGWSPLSHGAPALRDGSGL